MNSIINQPALLKKVNRWLNIIQYTLLPPICILCETLILSIKTHQKDLCSACEHDFIRLTNHCECCATLFASKNKGLLCGQCQKYPPSFNKVYAAFQHKGNARYLVNQLKFNNAFKNAHILAQLLAEYIEHHCTQYPQLIIPMPLHSERYKERGFNQSLEISKTLSRCLNIPINTQLCKRIKNTPHQVGLNSKQRQKNIKNAFKIDTVASNIQHIAIVDDVLTTGATANEITKLFKKTTITRVDIWVCTRSVK